LKVRAADLIRTSSWGSNRPPALKEFHVKEKKRGRQKVITKLHARLRFCKILIYIGACVVYQILAPQEQCNLGGGCRGRGGANAGAQGPDRVLRALHLPF
jgi:hypothetical protein